MEHEDWINTLLLEAHQNEQRAPEALIAAREHARTVLDAHSTD